MTDTPDKLALTEAYRRGYIRGYCDADNGIREEFEWTEAEWRAAFPEHFSPEH